MRLLFIVLLCGCSSAGTSTRGQRGRASFSYRATPGCEDGCNLEDNFVAGDGAHQSLTVSGAEFASASSSALAVASFTKSANGVDEVTGMPGDADLILLDAGGQEVDRVTVHVAATAHLDFDQGWSGAGPILLENVPISIAPVTKRDAGQRILLGSDAVRFSVSGSVTSLGAPSPAPGLPSSIVESLTLQGTAGMGELDGANGSQSFKIPIQVVTVNDLAHLVAEAGQPVLGTSGATVDVPVGITVSTDAGPVYGANCAWSVSDPSVEVAITDVANRLDRAAVSGVTFKMAMPGSFTATCTLGRLTAMVPLKRES